MIRFTQLNLFPRGVSKATQSSLRPLPGRNFALAIIDRLTLNPIAPRVELTDSSVRSASDQPEPKPSRRRRLRKWTVRTVLVVVVLIGVTLLFLPQIATRVLTRLTAGLELEQFETEVEEVGWNTATLSTLSAGNPGWKAEADGVLVRYSPWDLLRGQIQSLSFDQLRIEITQDAPSPETPPDEQPASKASAADTPSPTDENPFAWLHTLPETLAACPRMEAPQARLLSKRGTQQVQQTVDLTVQLDSRGSIRLVLRQD